jgi:multiple sugar transport system ATP-binding protein
VSFLELKSLVKTYPDGTQAVKGIDLGIEEGEFIVLLGPSGCGKTTTLRMIAGLEIATGGSILMGGRDVTTRRPSERDVGMVFQFYALYPHLSVRENIVFPLKCVRMGDAEREQRLAQVSRKMGLERLLRLNPRQLSGGDQQKVSLARAMVRQPSVYLMDEPLGTLDADQRLEMREFIRATQLETRVTTLYVTHDQEEAMSLADRIVVMEAGLICQVGEPVEVYENPASLFVANFVGSPGMNFLQGEVADGGAGSAFAPKGAHLSIPLGRKVRPGRATLGVRSEYVRADAGGHVTGRVLMDENMGSFRSVHVETECGRIVMRAPADHRHPVGETVRLGLDPAHISLFDSETGSRIR